MTPGDELFVWQEATPEGWGVIAAFIPVLGTVGALMSRNLEIARTMEPIARHHVAATGNPLRLARFEYTVSI